MAPYSKELAKVVAQVINMLEQKVYPPITDVPTYWLPGLQGGNSEASVTSVQISRHSVSATASDKCQGVFVMGRMTGGVWDERTREALTKGIISISLLELLGSVIVLDFAHRNHWLPDTRTGDGVVLRNDNI